MRHARNGLTRWWPRAALGLLAIGLAVLPLVADSYTIFLFYLLSINVGLAQSWNLVAGYTGLISLGHAAFFGFGAYTAALLITLAGVPFLPAAVGGGLVAALLAVAIAVPLFRFRGIYFAIGTLILAEAIRIWMINWDLTGGAQGLSLPLGSGPPLTAFYYIGLVVAAGATATLAFILRAKLGIGLRAIRDNEDVAQNMGVNTFRTKLCAFAMSAFLAGLTGAIHATKMSVIEPYSIFSVVWTISMVNVVIIGGIGTLAGPIVGAVVVTILSELLAHLYAVHLIITGLIFILVIRFLPAGVWGELARKRGGGEWLSDRPARRAPTTPT